MLIRFLQDFRGRETNEEFFLKGAEWDAPEGMAAQLLADGRAEEIKQRSRALADDTSDSKHRSKALADESDRKARSA